jgi:hypothetical protein
VPEDTISVWRTTVQLRDLLSQSLRDRTLGTLTTGESLGATHIRDTSRVEQRDYFRNYYFRVGADATAEEHRVISNNSGAIDLATGLAAAHTVNSRYEMHRRFSTVDYNDFIQMAILSASPEATTHDTIQTIAVTSNAILPGGLEDTYNLWEQFRYISRIVMEDTSGAQTIVVPDDQYEILVGTPARRIKFSTWMMSQTSAGRNILVEGTAPATGTVLADSELIKLPAEFIVVHARDQALGIMGQAEDRIGAWARLQQQQQAPRLEQLRDELTIFRRATPGARQVFA